MSRRKQVYTPQGGGFLEDDRQVLTEILAPLARPLSLLEFGPGQSTWFFLGLGDVKLVSLESDDAWYRAAVHEFRGVEHLELYRFENSPQLSIPEVDDRCFDVAFVDSPVGMPRRRIRLPGQVQLSRFNTLSYALERAPFAVLHDARRTAERRTLARLSSLGFCVEFHGTRRGLAVVRKGNS
jgi:hypothetical protein